MAYNKIINYYVRMMENTKNEEKSKPVFYCYKVFYYPRDILGDEFVDDKKI